MVGIAAYPFARFASLKVVSAKPPVSASAAAVCRGRTRGRRRNPAYGAIRAGVA